MYEILKTELFERWYKRQSLKIRLQIDGRFQRILDKDHFGHIRVLGKGLTELKFNNGNRIYYVIKNGVLIILLAGGNKNSQSKDIKLCKKIAREVLENE
jgi:putative addiction module killer protein